MLTSTTNYHPDPVLVLAMGIESAVETYLEQTNLYFTTAASQLNNNRLKLIKLKSN